MYFLIIILILTLLSLSIAGLSFAPWVPCWSKDLKRILALANIKENEVFYDLGCGDGRTVLYVAKNSKAKAVGAEMSFPMYLVCKMRQFFTGAGNVTFKCKNFFKENLSEADVVYFFGMPNSIKNKLKQKLENELKPGVRVISYAFHIDGWTPTKIDKPGEKDVSIFVYEIPNSNDQCPIKPQASISDSTFGI